MSTTGKADLSHGDDITDGIYFVIFSKLLMMYALLLIL